MSLTIFLNGKEQIIPSDAGVPTVDMLVTYLGFRADRVAVEKNGEIVPRATWATANLEQHDRIELVHFVGGGTIAASSPFNSVAKS